MLIRQPRNPDMKIKSFSKQRVERLPGQLNEISSVATPTSEMPAALTTLTTAAVVIAAVANKSENEAKISHFNNLISQA